MTAGSGPPERDLSDSHIVVAWIVTLPISAAVAACFYLLSGLVL